MRGLRPAEGWAENASEKALLVCLLAIAGVRAAFAFRSLHVASLNLCYPYLGADSYDWINNGLFWAGASVAPSLRPPGLPLVIAGLWKVGALSLLPYLNVLALGASTAALFALLRRRFDVAIAATACCFYVANAFVLEFSRVVMAETFAVPWLVLATLAFVRAADSPRAWIGFGLLLGIGFLFAYAAVPVAAGFGIALLVVEPGELRRRAPWVGAAAFSCIAGIWLVYRWSFYRAHPGGPRHGVEALLRPGLANAPAYIYAGFAIVGLVPFVLYLLGAIRFASAPMAHRRWRAAVLGPLAALTVFWCFVYDWADKRFLLYSLPFLICLLAEGLDSLRAFARRGRIAGLAAAGYLFAALLWNQMAYPSHAIEFLALSPVHFLRARLTLDAAAKSVLHFDAVRIAHLPDGVRSLLARALFGPRPAEASCSLVDPAISCLPTLRRDLDRVLPPGQPVGLRALRGWPSDYWSSTRRLSNELLRPVVLPGEADVTFEGIEDVPAGLDITHAPFIAHCGPYVVARTR